MAATLVLALMAAGCGAADEGSPEMRIDWDLSKRHTLDEVTWQDENLDLDTTSIEPLSSVRLQLPSNETLRVPDRVKRVILYRRSQGLEPLPGREGRILETVEVYTEPLTVDDAYEQALAYAKQFDLPRAPLDGWRQRREDGAEAATDRTSTTIVDRKLGGRGGPIPNVELLYSPNDERPWIVMVQFYWPPPKE